jgi:hypothetical protein
MNSCRRNTIYSLCLALLFSFSFGKSVSKTSNHFSLGEVGVITKPVREPARITVRIDSRSICLVGVPGEVRRIIIADLNGRIVANVKPGRIGARCHFPNRLKAGCYAVTLAIPGGDIRATCVVIS